MTNDAVGDNPKGPFAAVEGAEFDRFTRRLIGLARLHVAARMQHKVEAEDIVQSAYKSFVLRYRDTDVARQCLDDFWNLLTLITLRKCADRARYFSAERRDATREESVSPDGATEPWRVPLGREPTPDQAAIMAETLESLLAGFAPADRPVVELSLQGYTAAEVSEQLGRAERSVRRLRERLRKQLERLQVEQPD